MLKAATAWEKADAIVAFLDSFCGADREKLYE